MGDGAGEEKGDSEKMDGDDALSLTLLSLSETSHFSSSLSISFIPHHHSLSAFILFSLHFLKKRLHKRPAKKRVIDDHHRRKKEKGEESSSWKPESFLCRLHHLSITFSLSPLHSIPSFFLLRALFLLPNSLSRPPLFHIHCSTVSIFFLSVS